MRKPKGYWTKEKCQEEALKYNTKSEFSFRANSAYLISFRNNWLNEICSHMIKLGDKYKRCIYAIEFPNNHVYIGLTYNINKRFYEHINVENSTVYKYIKLTGLNPIIKALSDYVEVNIASELEGKKLNEYKNNNWIILNKNTCGGIGGCNIKWSKEDCQKEALKYKTRGEFQKKSKNIYTSSLRKNYLDDICSHMKEVNHWTKEKCREEALKYKTRRQFGKKSGSAYNSSRKNNWIEEICAHMKINHFKKYR